MMRVHGEIDLATAPLLHEALHDMLTADADASCLLDLSRVTFLSSTGLVVLARAAEAFERRRQPLGIVVQGNRPVIRPIELAGMQHALTLYHSLDDALADLASR